MVANIFLFTVQNQDLLSTEPGSYCEICDWNENLPSTGEHPSQDIQFSLSPEDPRFDTPLSPSPRDLEHVMPDMNFSASFFQVRVYYIIQEKANML